MGVTGAPGAGEGATVDGYEEWSRGGDAGSNDEEEPPGLHGSGDADPEVPTASLTGQGEWRDQGLDEVSAAPHRRRRVKVASAGVAAVVVAGAGAIGVVAATGARPSDHQLLAAAALTTASRRTADVTITGTLDIAGHVVQVRGAGGARFGTGGAFECSFSESLGGHTLVESERASGDVVYMSETLDGQNLIAHLLGGRQWLEIPVPLGGSSVIGGGTAFDPASELQAMRQRGDTIRRVGTTTVGGDAVTGYRVTPRVADVRRAELKALAAIGLPAAVKSQVMKAMSVIDRYAFVVWVDARNLLRRIEVSLASSSASASGQVSVTFSHYGAAVSVHLPPANQVVSFRHFIRAMIGGAGSSGSGSSSLAG